MNYRIGVDVGGTHTDCVLVGQDGTIYQKLKIQTQEHIEKSVAICIAAVTTDIDKKSIARITLGTTFATNALLEAKGLAPVGVIRIAGHKPAVPSGYDWPHVLQGCVLRDTITIHGGSRCDGSPVTPFCEKEALNAIRQLEKTQVQAIALIGAYAPLNDQEERICEQLIHTHFPHLFTSRSSEIGGLGFLQRESATILNASLKQAMKKGFHAIEREIRKQDITAPLYMVKNDGSILSMEETIHNPIYTISAGQTNSFIGASKLTRIEEAVVIDIGGTSTDIGLVEYGSAKRSCREASIGTVKLQFPIPDAISLALGGGTIVQLKGSEYLIGPESVGNALYHKALSFGGDTLTLTDIALKLGKMNIPGSHPEQVSIDTSIAARIMHDVEQRILQAAYMVRGKRTTIPIIICGGGAMIGYHNSMIVPSYAGFANAYGAAFAGISCTIDTTRSLLQREEVLNTLKKEVIAQTIQRGALPDTVTITQIDISPYAYSNEALCRIIISASGKS